MAGVRDDHSLDVGDSRGAEAVEIGVDVDRSASPRTSRMATRSKTGAARSAA